MKFPYLALLISLIIVPVRLSGQFFDTGTDPAGIKWLQVKTSKFTVIFPESYSAEGVRYAQSLDRSLDRLKSLYPSLKVRMPVVLHNYTTFSNGYVAWAPRRIEMFPTPEQNTIPLDPVEQLTQHELTHVMQLNSLRQRFLKILSYAGGEQVIGSSILFYPLWFIEGDAVLAESLLTPSGRGRSPAFQKDIKSLVVTRKKLFSYDKMMLGSFRDHTPDYYEFGYQVVAWSSAKYGHSIWNNTFRVTSGLPFTFDPVRISLHKDIRLSQPGLYRQAFDSLCVTWSNDLKKTNPADYGNINRPDGHRYRNYYSPVTDGKDGLVAIKTSLSEPPTIVLLDPAYKTERKIFIPGQLSPYVLSGAKGKIVWVEERPDERWENRTFSDIIIYDIYSGGVTRLSHRKRYMAAGISPDGKLIAASENSVSNINKLLIIDASSGGIVNSADVPGNAYLQRPVWSTDGTKITFISLTGSGEGVLCWTVNSGRWEWLVEPGRNDLQSSIIKDGTLYYVSSESGTDNIYMLPAGGAKEMVTNSRFGAYDVNLVGNDMCFSDFTPHGYRVTVISNNDISSHPVYNTKESFTINRFDTLKLEKPVLQGETFTPEPYRKWAHPFRFHSWMPFYADLEQLKSGTVAAKPGLTLLSQNTLSTVITTLGYEYANGRNNFHYRFTWKGWYPVFESGIDYGAAPVVYKSGVTVGDPSVLKPTVNFTNTVSLPLSFSTGRFSQFLWSALSASYQNNYVYMKETKTYDYGQTQVRGRIFFSNTDVLSLRDIYPRWAQVLDLTYSYYPADRSIYGPMTSFRSEFYFPGILRNQSLRLRFQTDYQTARMLLLSNNSDLPRGYTNMVSLDYRLYSADYAFPLFYPDLSIPSLLYLKRIRGGLFFDYATGDGNIYITNTGDVFRNYAETFRSAGGEILADFFVFRLPLMLSGGVQAAWKDLSGQPVFQLIININVFGMNIGRRKI